ncbi:MAG: YceD family protein [Vulcanimicrobiaceae bacterium]
MARKLLDVAAVLHAGRELAVRERLAAAPSAEFRAREPTRVDLLVRPSGQGLELVGTIGVDLEGACSRCLEPAVVRFDFDVRERFDPLAGELDPLAENNVLVGESLDLDDLVRQLIAAALPLVVLCSEDCPGLCPQCGCKLDLAHRPHPLAPGSTRWPI